MKDTSITIRLTDEEKEALKRAAAKNYTTISQYVRGVMKDHLKEVAGGNK